MKKNSKSMMSRSRGLYTFTLLLACWLFLVGFMMDPSDNEKITICHVPPGNPDNCHEITISMDALQTHLDHGDNLFCYDQEKYPDYLRLANHDETRVIKMFMVAKP